MIDFWVSTGRHAKFWVLSPAEAEKAPLPKSVHGVALDRDAAPASLQDCDQLLKLLLRRKADSMGRRQRVVLRSAMNATGVAPASIAALSPETATWLLWAMSWRGVSTPRHLALVRVCEGCALKRNEFSGLRWPPW